MSITDSKESLNCVTYWNECPFIKTIFFKGIIVITTILEYGGKAYSDHLLHRVRMENLNIIGSLCVLIFIWKMNSILSYYKHVIHIFIVIVSF